MGIARLVAARCCRIRREANRSRRTSRILWIHHKLFRRMTSRRSKLLVEVHLPKCTWSRRRALKTTTLWRFWRKSSSRSRICGPRLWVSTLLKVGILLTLYFINSRKIHPWTSKESLHRAAILRLPDWNKAVLGNWLLKWWWAIHLPQEGTQICWGASESVRCRIGGGAELLALARCSLQRSQAWKRAPRLRWPH